MKYDSIVSVITKAASVDLTTVEAARDELNIDGNDQDVRLARWITQMSAYMARWCNRVLALEKVSEQWIVADAVGWPWYPPTSNPPDPLMARRTPIVAIESITEDTNDPLTVEDYQFDAESGSIWRVHGSVRGWWSPMNITVVYTGGYEVPKAVPPDLEQACLALLKIRNDTNERDRMLRAQVVPGVLEEQWYNPASPGQPGMPPEVAELLTPYRRYNAP